MMPQPPPYSWIAAGALVAGLFANLLQAMMGFPILIFVNLACLLGLTWAAVLYQKRDATAFDPLVAAETIVAFGVTSLILSLVCAIFPLIASGKLEAGIAGQSLLRIATPFLEGLATAGLAPFFAMLLRNLVSEQEAKIDALGDTVGLTRAMSSLTGEIDMTRRSLMQLQGSAISAGQELQASAAGFSRDLQASVAGLRHELQASVTDLSQSMGTAAAASRGLADDLQSEGRRLNEALLAARHEIDGLASAANLGGGELRAMAAESANLTKSVVETGALLDALAKLIESVERFVAPGARKNP